tara:strand:+ start:102 stop:725 length:624 start_codon:yes stop_codon:yes gene_type:complete
MIKWTLSGQPLILASASETRAGLLKAAKLLFETVPAAIDEEAIKRSALQDGFSFDDLVILLAEMKAQTVSEQHRGYILGCDQILVCAEQLFNKPLGLAEAKAHLLALQGQKHVLITASVLFHDQKRIWHHLSRSTLTMRTLSEAEIDSYILGFPEACQATPGAYQVETGGAHLFTDIVGTNYDILGLPLLPLLAFLRERGLTVEKTG